MQGDECWRASSNEYKLSLKGCSLRIRYLYCCFNGIERMCLIISGRIVNREILGELRRAEEHVYQVVCSNSQ